MGVHFIVSLMSRHTVLCGLKSRGNRDHFTEKGLWMDGSAFCYKNVQISSLYCSFTVFYSFMAHKFAHKQKAHVLLYIKVGQRLLCALKCHWLATLTFNLNILWLTVRLGKVHNDRLSINMLVIYTSCITARAMKTASSLEIREAIVTVLLVCLFYAFFNSISVSYVGW